MSEYSRNVQKARGGNKAKVPVGKSETTRHAQTAREGKGKGKAPVLVLRPSVQSLRSDSSSIYSVQSESSVSAALSKYTGNAQKTRGGNSKIPVLNDKTLQHRVSDATIAPEWAPILPTTAYAPASPYDQVRQSTQQPKRHDSATSIRTIGSRAAVLESQVEYLDLQLQVERMSTAKDFETEREELKLQLAAAKARFGKVNAEADELDDELHDMHREMNALHNKNVDQAEEIVRLQAQTKELESAIRECKKCTELQAKVDELEKTALVSKIQLDHRAKQLVQKKHDNQTLERRIDELKAQRASIYSTQLAALEQGGKSLREQLRAKEHAEVDAQAKARLLKKENAALKKQVELLQKQEQSNATKPDPSIAIVATLKRENAELEKRIKRAHADVKKQCDELGAAAVIKIKGLEVKVEALEKEGGDLREQLRAKEETDTNAAAEMTRLAMQQVSDAQTEIAETKQNNVTLAKLVSHLQEQLNAREPDPSTAIIEALEQQNSATIGQLAEAVDEMLSTKSTMLHYEQEVDRLQKQIDDGERMKDRMEAERVKIMDSTTTSVPQKPIFSMPVYATYKSNSTLLTFSSIITIDTAPDLDMKNFIFTVPLAFSGITVMETEPMDTLTSFRDVQPILISVNITPSNPLRWSLMTKMRAAVSSNVPIDIQGPDRKTVQDFQQALHDTATVYDKNIALVASKQKLLVQQFHEIEGLKKRPACTVKGHQAWKDELQAACQLNELNNMVVQQQGEELQLLKKMQEKEGVVTAAHGKTRRVME
jgi:hypothetical protein